MEEKTNFFKSFWYAITNFEKYKEFAYFKSSTVVKYIAILLILFSLIITVALIIPTVKTINGGVEYFKEEFPDLNYSEGKLVVNSEEPIYLQDENLDAVILVDTTTTLEEEEKYLDEQKDNKTAILVFSDKLVVKTAALTSYTTYQYSNIQNNFGFDSFNKQDLLEQFTGTQAYKLYASLYLFLFAYMFLTYTVMIFIDIVILSILALLIARLYKTDLRYSNCIKIATYALTLPLLLQLVYIYVNTFTGFTIQYFAIMYDIISYIYVITAILIIKNDMAKQEIGLEKEVKIENKDDSEEIITNEEVEKQKQERKKKEEKKDPANEKKEKNEVDPPGVEPNNA